MSQETVILSLVDHENLSDKNVMEVTSPERAIQAAIESYKSAQVAGYELYKSWSTSLFQKYGPSKILYNDLSVLFNVFSIAIEELINECQELTSGEQNDRLIIFLNHTLELFKWIHSVAEEFATKELTAFLCFGLSVLKSYFVAHTNKTLGTDTSMLTKKSLAVHDLILGTLTNNPKTLSFESDNIWCLDNLMLHLCAVGELVTKLDINTAVHTWKCTVWLASQNSGKIQCDAESLEDIIWLKRPMSFLIQEIGRNVQTVYTEKSLKRSETELDEYLKIPNFYLRLLQRLSYDFSHVPFPICGDFLITLSIVLLPPAYIIDTHVHKLVTGHITTGLIKLIPSAYKNLLFFEYLLNDRIGDINISESFYAIILEVFKLIILRGEVENLNPQILEAAFTRCSKSPHILLSIPTYNRLIETLSALQIRFRLKQVDMILVSCVLQDDIVLALPAIDIWCTILRLSDSSTRLSNLKFWKSVSEHFAVFSNRLPALYVEVLVKRIYALLITQEKSMIWNDFNPRVLQNNRFLSILGLNEISDTNIYQSTVQQLDMKLMRLVEEFPKNLTKENFYKIIEYLKLLTTILLRNSKLIEMLLEYLAVAMKNKKFTLLVQSIYDYLAVRVYLINESTMLNILTELSMQFCNFDDYSAKSSIVGFLKRTSAISEFERQSQHILRILENDKIMKLFTNQEEPTYEGSYPEKNDALLLEILKNRSVQKAERSKLSVMEEELPATKKIKTETEVEVVLDYLENNVKILKSMRQRGQLSSSNAERLKRIIGNINTS